MSGTSSSCTPTTILCSTTVQPGMMQMSCLQLAGLILHPSGHGVQTADKTVLVNAVCAKKGQANKFIQTC